MKLWKKLNGLKTWQGSLLGAFIGFLIASIVWTSSILSFKLPYETLLPLHILSTILIMPLALILILIFAIFGLGSSDPWAAEGIAIFALYLAPIVYTGIGALIGYFIGRHKTRKNLVRHEHLRTPN